MGFLAAIPFAAIGSGIASAATATGAALTSETAGTIATVAGTAISAASSVLGGIADSNNQNAMMAYQAQAQENENQYQKNMADYNQGLSNQQAKEVEIEAAEQERRKRAENERFTGMQRALYGKSGAALYSGSPLAVLGDSAANMEMEALDIGRAGRVEAMALREQGKIYGYQGNMAMTRGTYTGKSNGSLLRGIGDGIAGFASAGSKLAGTWNSQKVTPVPTTGGRDAWAMARRPSFAGNIA